MLIGKEKLWERILDYKYSGTINGVGRANRRWSLWWTDVANIDSGEGEFSIVCGEVIERYWGRARFLILGGPLGGKEKLEESLLGLIWKDRSKKTRELKMWCREEMKPMGGNSEFDTKEERLEEELNDLVQRVKLRGNVKDRWMWAKGGHPVNEAYSYIIEGILNCIGSERDLAIAWNKFIPLKVFVLVWRIWKNRIPTRDNLSKRVILVDSQKSCLFVQ
ncbi:unnamed protein product [Vicia faba]|uniref:Reverse transcriptase zinc-binding domain-containing protein n=1 Tax=Vicia faba TaxID=3906 RepID=A0AAV0ZG38_VICFA|nr:unnamed protein product [Vicia faba]